MLERASRIDIIAWIDAHLLAILSSHISGMGCEMDVGYQRSGIAIGFQAGRDVLHVLCLTGTLSGETQQLSTCIDDAFGLCHTTLRIVGISRSHRLDADRVVATNGNLANMGDG